MQTVPITSASNTTYSTYTLVETGTGEPGVPTGARDAAHQALRIGAAIDTSGGTAANLRFVLTDGVTIFKYVDYTLTVTAVRTGIAGNSGAYHMTVAGGASNNDMLDLMGADSGSGKVWRVGLAGALAGSATTLTLYLEPTRAI